MSVNLGLEFCKSLIDSFEGNCMPALPDLEIIGCISVVMSGDRVNCQVVLKRIISVSCLVVVHSGCSPGDPKEDSR